MSGVSKRMPRELWFQTEKAAQKVQNIVGGRIKDVWTIDWDKTGHLAPMVNYRLRYKLAPGLIEKWESLKTITVEQAIVIVIAHFNGLVDIKSYKKLAEMWVFEVETYACDDKELLKDQVLCVYKSGEKKVVFQPKEPEFMAKLKKTKRIRL